MNHRHRVGAEYARLLLVVAVLFALMPWLAQPAAGASPAPQEINLAAGDDGSTVEMSGGQILVLQLPGNPSTGYRWEVDTPGTDLMRQIGESFVPESDLLGAPGTMTLRLAPTRAGTARLALSFRQVWEDAAPLRTFTVDVRAAGATDAATVEAYLAALPAPATPPEWLTVPAPTKEQQLMTSPTVPTAFNWCDQGGCTPVRNQGYCGSCWAFGTVGPLESMIKLNGGGDKDLSEQYLLSCNSEGFDCGGGRWVHEMHQSPGSVYEYDEPYQADDTVPCGAPYTYHEQISGWGWVDPGDYNPTAAAIKQAIYDHGPVSATLCAGPAFDDYQSGVFSADEGYYCSGSVNHGITLVGWDDSLGAWRLRNSWGSSWGENGYMWIAYGTSYVGYMAAYINYGTVPHGPTAPTGLTATAVSSSQINVGWTDNSSNESGFRIERSPNGSSGWTEIGTVGAGVHSYSNMGLNAGTWYYYRVAAYNAAGTSAYTNVASALTPSTAPTAPSNLNATGVSATRINLGWMDNSSDETGFLIQRSTTGTGGWTQIGTMGAGSRSYADTGLVPGSRYYYRVAAYNTAGNSPYSNMASAMAQAPNYDVRVYLPFASRGLDSAPPPTGLPLYESFESGTVPPAGWTLIQTNPRDTWVVMPSEVNPFDGTYGAMCNYDADLGYQDEVLLSPTFAAGRVALAFYSAGSLVWCRDEYDNCDLNVWLVVGSWGGGDDIFVHTADNDWTDTLTWSYSNLDLAPFVPAGTPVRVAFQYVGQDGDIVGLDAIHLALY